MSSNMANLKAVRKAEAERSRVGAKPLQLACAKQGPLNMKARRRTVAASLRPNGRRRAVKPPSRKSKGSHMSVPRAVAKAVVRWADWTPGTSLPEERVRRAHERAIAGRPMTNYTNGRSKETSKGTQKCPNNS